MIKILSGRFQQCFGPFTMLLVTGSSSGGGLIDIDLITSFPVRNIGHT